MENLYTAENVLNIRVAAEAEGVRSGQIETRPLDNLAVELGFDPAIKKVDRQVGKHTLE